MKNDLLNVFGQPDDFKMALYSSWSDAAEAQCLIIKLKARYHFNAELVEELEEVLTQLAECGDSVQSFAPNFHRKTLQDWAEAAAEANHP